MGGEREVCTNMCVIVGSLWAICGQRGREIEGEGEGKRGGEGKVEGGGGEREGEGGRGRERMRRRRGEGRGGRQVLWALGAIYVLVFEGWGSYNHPFVTSRKR